MAVHVYLYLGGAWVEGDGAGRAVVAPAAPPALYGLLFCSVASSAGNELEIKIKRKKKKISGTRRGGFQSKK